MSAAPAVRYVTVAGTIIHTGRASITARVNGRVQLVDRRHVVDFTADTVTVPEWLAGELCMKPLEACLTDQDVAVRFGTSVDWIYRNIQTLVQDEGFPAPVTHIGRRRYDPAKVDAWFRRDPEAAAALVDVKDRRAALRGRREAATAAAVGAAPRGRPTPMLHAHFSEPHDDEEAAWRAALAEEYGEDGQ